MEVCVKTLDRTVRLQLPEKAVGADLMAAVELSGMLGQQQCYLKAGEQVISPLSSLANVTSPVLAIPGDAPTDMVEVQVEFLSKRHSLHCPADMPFSSLKLALGKRFYLLPDDFCVLTSSGEMDPSLPISVLKDTLKVQTNTQYPPAGFPVQVKTLTGKTITLTVTRELEVDQVKRMIGEAQGEYWEDLKLICAGKCVISGQCIGDYNIAAGSMLHCVVRSRRYFS